MSDTQRTGIVLVVQSGKNPGRKLKLRAGEVVIGRDEDCRIRLASHDVSRKHCRLRCSAEGVRVTDLNSRNGTYVNEVRIDSETWLEPGDRLRVGPLILEWPGRQPAESGSGQASAAAPGMAAALGKKDEGTSDDEVAAWLSGEMPTRDDIPGDTTIVSRGDSAADSSEKIPPASRAQFETVAEEAEDIFRRHREMVARRDASS